MAFAQVHGADMNLLIEVLPFASGEIVAGMASDEGG